MSRAEARVLGLKVYFNGKPCRRRGHLADRDVRKSGCVECKSEYRARTSKQAVARAFKWAKQNPERRRLIARRWDQNNPEKMAACRQRWDLENPGRRAAFCRNRQAAQRHRMPIWADAKRISDFYAACPEGMTVDHILPLQGEKVSGLHVEANLQYLSPSENSVKKNSFEPYSESFAQ